MGTYALPTKEYRCHQSFNFDDTEAETVSEWITSIPKDAVLVLDSVNGNPLYKGRCFTSYNAKERSISNKTLVISEFQYHSFIGLGKKTNILSQKRVHTILQRIDSLYCHRCLLSNGILQPKTFSGIIKISNDQHKA